MKRYESMTDKEILQELKTSSDGISSAEAVRRNSKYGLNVLPSKKSDSIFKIFLMQFLNAITIIMFVACVLSFLIGEYTDAVAIVIIIIIDALLGTIQEWRANKSALALAKMLKMKQVTLRDNKEELIDSELLTIGDIIILASGDKVLADARVIGANNFSVDEAILTGESTASIKNSQPIKGESSVTDWSNMVFAGTSVLTGRAIAVVTRIGVDTEIGKIALKVNSTKSMPSPLTIRMNKFTKQISFLIIFIAIFLTVILVINGAKIEEILITVVGLSVSAMPEGLPLAITLALTIGASRMAKRNVIVKQLNSVEALGSCTVIASDKTGTLTVNEQTAKVIVLPNGITYQVTGVGYKPRGEVIGDKRFYSMVKDIAKVGVLNNEAGISVSRNKIKTYGDSIDIAFLVLGIKERINIRGIKKISQIPYESSNQFSAVYYRENKQNMCSVKGSLEVVMGLCSKMYDGTKVVKIDREMILKENRELASQGYRVIALARGNMSDFDKKEYYQKEDIPKLTFMGLVGFIDPVREEVKEAIERCQNAGIKVVMITGDHPLTAFHVAKELGIASDYSEVATEDDIQNELAKGKMILADYVSEKKIFTRVSPLTKLEIVEAYIRNGEYVAVTGDGVNDAPALKAANIGVSMGSGTDVSKETSNMIIIDDNFKSIVSGVKQGRIAYANIRKVIYMLISCGLAEVLFFSLSIVNGLPIPLLAVQLIWLNLVTDGLQDLALSFEKGEDKVMVEPPRDPKESLFDKLLIEEIILSGTVIGLIVFIVWVLLIRV